MDGSPAIGCAPICRFSWLACGDLSVVPLADALRGRVVVWQWGRCRISCQAAPARTAQRACRHGGRNSAVSHTSGGES